MSIPYGPILVVEDIPHILEYLDVTLRFKGYPVVTARNGDEALARIAQERPALIITDILMPRLDGFALAHKVRTDPKTRDIPIIFISATYITPEDREFALSLGAVTFMEKPVDTDELLLTVAEILTRGPVNPPPPLPDEAFLRGYRARLQAKLQQKNQQIARAERLLETAPPEQRESFLALLEQTRAQRDEIEAELHQIHRLLQNNGGPPAS